MKTFKLVPGPDGSMSSNADDVGSGSWLYRDKGRINGNGACLGWHSGNGHGDGNDYGDASGDGYVFSGNGRIFEVTP